MPKLNSMKTKKSSTEDNFSYYYFLPKRPDNNPPFVSVLVSFTCCFFLSL